MAVKPINQIQPRSIDISCPFSVTSFLGLSTDIKPINVGVGSTFEETNTGSIYKFDGTSWYPTLQGSTGIAPDGTPYNTTLSLFDLENYNGKVFTFSKTNVGVANNGYFDIRVKAGIKQVNLEIIYSSEGKAYFKTYLNTAYSANGTVRTPFPRNSGSTQTLTATIYEAPTVSTLGQLRGDDFIGKSSGNPQTRAGGGGTVSGTIIAPTHDLLIRLQNVSGGVADLNLIINLLEF